MRSELKILTGGFPVYEGKHIDKINALREVASMKRMKDVPVLTRGQVLFSTAESANDEPRSCFNCPMYYEAGRCKYFGSRTKIHKFTEAGIEYWPVCGYWVYGSPSKDEPKYVDIPMSPSDAGLGWINAPKPGVAHSGSCCGGGNNGDDCDLWRTEGTEAKWDAVSGFCRVLQEPTGNLDCCTCWQDDDWIPNQTAQQFLKNKP